MDLSSLCGNLPLKRQLDAQTARRGLSHAYILSGAPGSGRTTLARLLAAAMVCEAQDDARKPCGQCPPCKKVLAGIHPDVQTTGEDGKDITVAQVRQLRADAYIRPNEAPRKVYVLKNAQTMNASAQNAMLKLLEEGPAYAAFFLLTDNAAALLQTVRSRCETLTLAPVTAEEALTWLSRRYPDKPMDLLRQAAGRCEGLLGRAVAELEESGGEESQARQEAMELLRRLEEGSELALAEFCVGLEKWDREALTALLEETLLLVRDALVIQSGAAPAEQDSDRRAAAAQAARSLTGRALLAMADTCETLRAAGGFNTGAGHLAGWLCAALAGDGLRPRSPA